MGITMNKEKRKALAAEIAKDLKKHRKTSVHFLHN